MHFRIGRAKASSTRNVSCIGAYRLWFGLKAGAQAESRAAPDGLTQTD